MQTRWRALLSGSPQQEALSVARDVALILARDYSPSTFPEASLAEGHAGLALLFDVAARVWPAEETWPAARSRSVDHVMNAIAESVMDANLYKGLAGAGFALQQLAHLQLLPKLLEDTDEDELAEIDAALWQHLATTDACQGDYDLIFGWVGLGVYGLERRHRAMGAACAARVVERLAETAERSPDGTITWFTPRRLLTDWQQERYPRGCYNVGLAHGVVGIAAFLARAVTLEGDIGEKARELLTGCLKWLRAQRTPADASEILGLPLVGERPTWCYGDLGVATALLLASHVDAHSRAEALEVTSLEHGFDPHAAIHLTVCHGLAGTGHLFNRIYQATGDERIEKAARLWISRTISHRRPDIAVAGYPDVTGKGDAELFPRAGILSGAAGVALVLLAAATDHEPVWDRMLLASGDPLDEVSTTG